MLGRRYIGIELNPEFAALPRSGSPTRGRGTGGDHCGEKAQADHQGGRWSGENTSQKSRLRKSGMAVRTGPCDGPYCASLTRRFPQEGDYEGAAKRESQPLTVQKHEPSGNGEYSQVDPATGNQDNTRESQWEMAWKFTR
jgi:hypothetical protein